MQYMISVVKRGTYELIETKNQTKILILDSKKTYAWINAVAIGEILVSSHKKHKADCILALGNYRLYGIKDEPELSDQMHLELHVGCGVWQGYLLLTGLPTKTNDKKRIIPTREIITKSSEEAFPQVCECCVA